MIINCRRCGKPSELRKGTVTGNNVAKYRQLEDEINSSKVLKLEFSKRLCLSCLEELSTWITNTTKRAHVRILPQQPPRRNKFPS
jgi:hypothetical protein